ncbi:MAG: ImmA/IrrE family metallo-endopeptidase [Pseudomonadota bacterium]
MKKMAENRYPHSATLFRFCKEALQIRYTGGVKVIDQDVGAILGYDPADCSHWKKGKKNIRSYSTIRTIADHLNVDDRLLVEITAGKVGLEEALFEYRGYGNFSLTGKSLENVRKEYFTNPQRWQQTDSVQRTSFEDVFRVDRPAIEAIVEKIVAMGNFIEAPIYVPEVFQLFSNIKIERDESMGEAVRVINDGQGVNLRTVVRYKGMEGRPYVRFLMAKELFLFLVRSGNQMVRHLQQASSEIIEIQANIFVENLLVPSRMLGAAIQAADPTKDLVQQLSETFWVSKTFMNQRLRDYLENI